MDNKLQPQFSFIIPIYNAQPYIERCIDSLLNQDASFEIIAVDDGSSDNSLSILKSYETRFPNIFTIIHQNNSGIGPTRNIGFSYAQGEYVWFIDNDDWIKPNCLSEIYTLITSSYIDILCINHIHTESYNIAENFKIGGEVLFEQYSSQKAIIFEFDAPWSKIYQRQFLLNENIFFPNLSGEDTAEVYRLFSKTNKIYKTNQIFYAWYNRKGSVSNSYTDESLKTFLKTIHILIQQKNDNPSLKNEFEYLLIRKTEMIIHFLKYEQKQVNNLSHFVSFYLTEFQKIYETLDYKNNIYKYLFLLMETKEKNIQRFYESTFSWKICRLLYKCKTILKKYVCKILPKAHEKS